jgi:hypothetical protein
MEALGGNSLWSDCLLGYHAAIVYYWLLNAVFLFSPRVAYQFMEVRAALCAAVLVYILSMAHTLRFYLAYTYIPTYILHVNSSWSRMRSIHTRPF